MTYEEAINHVMCSKIMIDDEEDKLLHIIIDTALKRQIPKKPIFVESTPGLMSSFWWECPICDNSVVGKDYFCSFCGQALDWSDKK